MASNCRVLELVFDLLFRQRLAVYLNVRINQVVNRPRSARLQLEIAAHRERNARGVEMAEIIIAQLRMLPRFRCVHRNPLAAGVKFRPAMITRDFARARCAERKANRKARRDSPRARERDEQRMEVGAVALFDVARIDGVAAAPSIPALVIRHVRDYVVVDGPSLFVGRTVGIAHLGAHQLYLSVDRNQAVRASG